MPPRYPKFGVLNRIEKPLIAERIDVRNVSVPSIIKTVSDEVFSPNSLLNTGPYIGIVLRVENNVNNPTPGGFISSFYDFIKASQRPKFVEVKVRIPEIHTMLPIPDTLGKDSRDHATINMYPTFTGQGDDLPIPEVGTLVWVDFGNKVNFTKPIYIKPVASSQMNIPNNGIEDVTPSSIFDSNCNDKLLSKPPTGDLLTGLNKALAYTGLFPGIRSSVLANSKEYKFLKGERFSVSALNKWEKAIKNNGTPGTTWIGTSLVNGIADSNHIEGKRSTIVFSPNKTDFALPIEIMYWFHGNGEFGNNYDFTSRLSPIIKKLSAEKKRNFVIVIPELPWGINAKTKGQDIKVFEGGFASFHREILTIIKENFSETLNVGYVSLAAFNQGVAAVKEASVSGLDTVKPDKITLAEGVYKDYLQSIWDGFANKYSDLEFNILVLKNSVSYRNVEKFVEKTKINKNTKVETYTGLSHNQIGDLAIEYMNQTLLEEQKEENKKTADDLFQKKINEDEIVEGAELIDKQKQGKQLPKYIDIKPPLVPSNNIASSYVPKQSSTLKKPKNVEIKNAVEFKEARIRVNDYGTLTGQEATLTNVQGVGGSNIMVHVLVAKRLASLNQAWMNENPGVPRIEIASGWRKRRFASQAQYEVFLTQKYGSISEGRKYIAYESPHETGLAIDIGNNGLSPISATNEQQKQTRLYKWLKNNAHKYGFTPYKYEAWHWEVRIPRESWATGEEFTDKYAVRVENIGNSDHSPDMRNNGENCTRSLGAMITSNVLSEELNKTFGTPNAQGFLEEQQKRNLIKELSNKLGIEPEVAQAFFKVESGGKSGFCANTGRALIRFEPHVFADPIRLKKAGVDESKVPWAANSVAERKKKWQELGFSHGSSCSTNENEYRALLEAVKINEEHAYRSISVGAAQIMGFNYKTVGFKSAKEMFLSYSGSEEAQIKGFFMYVANRAGGKLLSALKRKDFVTAALYYNGKGKEQLYASKLDKYYNQYKSSGAYA